MKKDFKFIDLFAGIGGFHQAMSQLGGKCVFAIEINHDTAKTYMENYGMSNVEGDITNVDLDKIPDHDVLCAGFPCQPFSKAGKQKGFNDERGTLFFQIIKILKNQIMRSYAGPRFLILENVRNLLSHDNGNTWNKMKEELINIHYNVIEQPVLVSPHDFCVPQLRDRAIILAVRSDYFNEPIKPIDLNIKHRKRNLLNIHSFLLNCNEQEYDLSKYALSQYEEKVLHMWDEFIKGINKKIIGFPIWSDWFNMHKAIPNDCSNWKSDFIKKNRKLYLENKTFIDKWLKKYDFLSWVKPTDKKFEWQVEGKIKSVFDGIIQFRPSGIRVKQPTECPTLVAISHIPIVSINGQHRYITPREAAYLQSFPSTFKIPDSDRLAYKQFGNAVNVKVIKNVFKKFEEIIEKYKKIKKNFKTKQGVESIWRMKFN